MRNPTGPPSLPVQKPSNICLRYFMTPAKVFQLSSDPLQNSSDICLWYFMTPAKAFTLSFIPLQKPCDICEDIMTPLAKALQYMFKIFQDPCKNPPAFLLSLPRKSLQHISKIFLDPCQSQPAFLHTTLVFFHPLYSLQKLSDICIRLFVTPGKALWFSSCKSPPIYVYDILWPMQKPISSSTLPPS